MTSRALFEVGSLIIVLCVIVPAPYFGSYAIILITLQLKLKMSQKWYKKASVQTAIVTGLFLIIAAIVAGFFDLYKINLQTKKKEAPSVTKTIKSDTLNYESEQYNKYKYLPENQIRVEITKSLGENNLKKGTTLLKYLRTDKAKEEEYDRIFQFCIKHTKLDTAEVVSELFFSPEKKQAAKKIIAKEKYKIEKNR